MTPQPSRIAVPSFVLAIMMPVVLVQGVGAQSPASPVTSAPLLPIPPWAFTLPSPGQTAPPASAADSVPRGLPGTSVRLSVVDTRNSFQVPDWRPTEHPPMPEIVAKGRAPRVLACGFCHLPNGQGRPENANLTSLSVGYILRQMDDFRAGRRRSSEPRMRPPALMDTIAMHATDDEARIAAEYFSRVKPRRWTRVVETATVPKSVINRTGMHVAAPGDEREAIGARIIEMAEDVERTELRDAGSGFVAYVPPGSVARGKKLVETGGNGRTQPCAACHGKDYRGLATVPSIAGMTDVPTIAGRSPSYIVRQLYDFRNGARAGTAAAPMALNVAKLSPDDIVDIAAYLATRTP